MATTDVNVNLTSLEGETFEVSMDVVQLSEVVKIMVNQDGKLYLTFEWYIGNTFLPYSVSNFPFSSPSPICTN